MRAERLAGAHRSLRARGAIALLASLAIVASASTGSGLARASAPAGAARAAAAPKGGPLTVWLGGILAQATPGSAYRRWYDQEIAAFQKLYPGTTVKTVLLDPDGVKQTAQYRAAFGGGQHIDVAMMYPGGYTTEFGDELTDLRKAAPAVLAQYNPSILAYGCPKFNCANGAPEYVAPFDVSGWVIGYNKKIFAKLGIKAPFKTWNDMLAAGKKMKAAGYVPFQMGNRDGYMADAFLSNMESSYLKPSDISAFLSGKLKLTDSKFVAPLQKFADLFSQGLVNKDACSLEQLASQRDFIAGKTGTVATYDYANIYKTMKNNLGIMTWPAVNGAPNVGNAGPAAQVGQGWVVPKGTKNAPLATALLAFLTSAKAQTAQFTIAGDPPANLKASTATPPDPASGAAATYFQHATILSLDSVMPLRTQNTYYKITNLALCGKNSPQQAMQSIQDVFARENR
jgi:ABC-type glycerol-3-phosphate transport system substrate-binding protein